MNNKDQSERVVKAAHPELDRDTAHHTAETYRSIARSTGGTVSEMAIQSRRAEQLSAEGGDVSA